MDFEDGFREFMSLYPLDQQLYVMIPSTHNPWGLEAMMGWLEVREFTLAAEQRVTYIPPRGVGHHGYPRTETLQIPAGFPTTGAALIVDDGIEDGGTLRAAYNALLNKGFGSDNIWFLAMDILLEYGARSMPCDRAKVFLDYMRALR